MTGIVDNLLADLIWSVVAVVFGYLLLRRQTRGLAQLLGTTSDRRLLIVLPDMVVREGGTAGDYRQDGFVGNVVSRREFEAAVALRESLTDPLVRLLRPRTPVLPSGRIAGSGPVEGTEFCPPAADLAATSRAPDPFAHLPSRLSGRSLVLIGGPVYNHLTGLGFRHPAAQAVPEQQGTDGEWGLRVKTGPLAGQFFAGRGSAPDTEIAIVQSFTAVAGGPRITICAGSSDSATQAGVMFLLANWRRIARKCRRHPYAFLLHVDTHSGGARLQTGIVDGQPFTL
ncbi:hypothetical protein [Streptomyces sp. VRA16 Mangrove soil]|uniref:hypothetical protein n=1 Tax=Streptomyces sp. VRA16 Mangrove soil TaxID=2817434 RepID=UPI001A9E5F32|nr:hypothetical protein [Streptomyces sp. VRA16 Mangrove soil]MBO1330800.1 hypothetical protein [Streptomyces sp. VRA16 Mangrove soil]